MRRGLYPSTAIWLISGHQSPTLAIFVIDAPIGEESVLHVAGLGRIGRRRAGTVGDGNEGSGSTSGRPRRLTGVRRLPLRTVLIIVVAVPSMTFTPLLGSGMYQLATQWQAEKIQMDLATDYRRQTCGQPVLQP